MNSTARFALFFAPSDDSPLGVYGATVLRRKAQSPSEWVNPSIPVNFENTPVWRSCVEVPAHYGFHATIQAPFELQSSYAVSELQRDLADFCTHQKPLSLEGLGPRRTQRYEALAFEQQPPEVKNFAAACIEQFNQYRAPLSDEDLCRRQKKALSPSQIGYLEDFGYPYVFDDFNFHMTLSGNMPENENGYYLQWLTALYAVMVPEPPILDRLSLFQQTDRKSPFVRIAEYPFAQV